MAEMNFDIMNLVRKNVRDLKPYSSARDEFNESHQNMTFLDANENPFETVVNRYPDPQQKRLKDLFASIRNVESQQILLGNGSDEVLDLIIRAFCEPCKDNLVILPPTYGMYQVLANINAVETKCVLLNKKFQPKINAILKAVDENSKLLFICSPNNPTSQSIDANKIEFLLKNFRGIVIIDEAYIDFSSSLSWVNRLNDFPNLIVTQTLSKAYGMAGIRMGICYASRDIISILNKIKPPYNINELTQQYAINALKKRNQLSEEVQTILEERVNLMNELQPIKFIEKIYKSDANFILIRVDDANLRYDQLTKRGIVVRNRSNQPLCRNCLRLTVGTPGENRKLIKVLEQISQQV